MKQLYLVGHHTADGEFGWEFIGIFSSDTAAAKECFDEYYFYAPVELDKAIHGETRQFPNICYPHLYNKITSNNEEK